VLDVHLVDDARARRHDLELAKRLLAPAQEREPLPVALELEIDVPVERVRAAEDVRDDRVVDDQLGRDQRVDPGRVTAELPHGLPHRGEVHHGGHTREVLEDHPGRRERDLGVRLGLRVPLGKRGHMLGGDVLPVLVPEQVLQQDFQAERQVAGGGDGIQPVDGVASVPRPAGWHGSLGCSPSSGAHLLSASRLLGIRIRPSPASCRSPAPALPAPLPAGTSPPADAERDISMSR
jgi:hypothetical protein